jgi:hypothetical protein
MSNIEGIERMSTSESIEEVGKIKVCRKKENEKND